MNFRMLSLILLLVSFYCQADDTAWTQSWTDAIKAFAQKDYALAEQKYSEAISYLVSINDQNHPALYVDRGIALQLLNKYDQAVQDFTIAIESDAILAKDKIRAVLHRMASYVSLKLNDETLADFALLRSISTDFPILTDSSDTIVIRNLPNSDILRKGIQYLFLKLGICNDASDIKFYNFTTCIITKKCPCAPKALTTNTITTNIPSVTGPCGVASTTALSVSPTLVSHSSSMALFGALVSILQDICIWCESGAGIYVNCIEPFQKDILDPFLYYAGLLAKDIGEDIVDLLNKLQSELEKPSATSATGTTPPVTTPAAA